jgi:hypothetical protein
VSWVKGVKEVNGINETNGGNETKGINEVNEVNGDIVPDLIENSIPAWPCHKNPQRPELVT